jgi:hypothetical protein
MAAQLVRLIEVPAQPGYEWTSVAWLRKQVHLGALANWKVKGMVLIDLEEIDALVSAGRREATA